MLMEIFEKMDTEYRRLDSESEREYMARLYRTLFEKESGDHTIDDVIKFSYVDCDPEARSYELEFHPEKWQENHNHVLHGGLTTTVHDITMGLLAKYYLPHKDLVTVQIGVDFCLPVKMDAPLRMRAYCVKCGRHLAFMRSEMIDEESGKILSSANGLYM